MQKQRSKVFLVFDKKAHKERGNELRLFFCTFRVFLKEKAQCHDDDDEQLKPPQKIKYTTSKNITIAPPITNFPFMEFHHICDRNALALR